MSDSTSRPKPVYGGMMKKPREHANALALVDLELDELEGLRATPIVDAAC
jgi:hypothetical protein